MIDLVEAVAKAVEGQGCPLDWSECLEIAEAALAAIEAQGLVILPKELGGEYICKCGIRVEPHRCRDTKGAF
jgi:hypothetical protein